MKYLVSSFLLFHIVYIAYAQNPPQFIWANGIICVEDSCAGIGDISIDKNENIYSCGSFRGSVNLFRGGGTSKYSTNSICDGFVSKLDSNGQTQWINVYQNNDFIFCSKIIYDGLDHIYVLGHFKGTIDFDTNSSNGYHISQGYASVYLLKLDLSGNYVWSISTTGGDVIYPTDMVFDNNGDIIVVGLLEGQADFDPGSGSYYLNGGSHSSSFIAKYSQTGNLKWAKLNARGGSVYTYKIVCDSKNNLVLGGILSFASDFDPGPSNYYVSRSNNQSDGYVQKLDSSGNLIWVKPIQATLNARVLDLDIDGLDNIYITGNFRWNIQLDKLYNYNKSYAANQSEDGFIAVIAPNGDFKRSAQLHGNFDVSSNQIEVDDDGTIYISGTFTDSIDLDPGPSKNLKVSLGQEDVFIACLDSNLNFLWGRKYGGWHIDRVGLFELQRSKYLYSAGRVSDSADIDPTTGYKVLDYIPYYVYNYFNWTTFLQKLCLKCECKSDTVDVTVSSCTAYQFGNLILNQSGKYQKLFENYDGCDSLVNLNLEILDTSITHIISAACDSFSYNSNSYHQSGTYTFLYQNVHGCDSTVELSLTINHAQLDSNDIDVSPITGDPFSPFYLQSFRNKNEIVCWSINKIIDTCSKNLTLKIPDIGNYLVLYKLTDSNGCVVSDSIRISVKNNTIFIPNAFTPNGDEKNAFFGPIGNGVKQFQINIYNRWGEEIFNQNSVYWDGKIEGKELPTGVYQYLITVWDIDNKVQNYRGQVLLLR